MKHFPLLISLAIAMPAVAQTRTEQVLPEMKVIVLSLIHISEPTRPY